MYFPCLKSILLHALQIPSTQVQDSNTDLQNKGELSIQTQLKIQGRSPALELNNGTHYRAARNVTVAPGMKSIAYFAEWVCQIW